MKDSGHDPIAAMGKAKAILAPMSGVTDIPFRLLCRKLGCRFAFTEMIDINGINYKNRKTFEFIKRVDGDDPLGVQLVGQDEEKFIRAAEVCMKNGFDVLDVNAGCPARKVVTPGKGSALMKTPDKLAAIVRRLVKEISVPITVKIRSGWTEDSLNYLEVAKAVEAAGASAICVHPRTKEQMYKGKADHNVTREIKESVSIPVFASGNIFSAADAKNIIEETSCDGIFVARGALGHPWLFEQINGRLSGNLDIEGPGFEGIKKIMIEHFDLCYRFYDAGRISSRMYKHVAWYLKGHKNLNEIMNEYRKTNSPDTFRSFVERLRVDDKNRLEST